MPRLVGEEVRVFRKGGGPVVVGGGTFQKGGHAWISGFWNNRGYPCYSFFSLGHSDWHDCFRIESRHQKL